MGLFRLNKNIKKLVIRQIIELDPRWMIESCTPKHSSEKGCRKYKTYDQFIALAYGQLNKCYTLNDISTGIGVSDTFVEDLGLTQSPARSTMSDGKKKRDWKAFEPLYYMLLKHYERVLKSESQPNIIKEVKDQKIKLIDSTTISLCLNMFDWAKFWTAKGSLKIHNRWDDNLQIPDLVNITEAKTHDRYGIGHVFFQKEQLL